MKKHVFSILLVSAAAGLGTAAFIGGNNMQSAKAEGEEPKTWMVTVRCDFAAPKGWGDVSDYKFHCWGDGGNDTYASMSNIVNHTFITDVVMTDSQTINGGQFMFKQSGVQKYSMNVDLSATKDSHSKAYISDYDNETGWTEDFSEEGHPWKFNVVDFTTSDSMFITDSVNAVNFTADPSKAEYNIKNFEVTDTSTVYSFNIAGLELESSIIKSGCASLITADANGFTFNEVGNYDIYYSSIPNDGYVWISKQEPVIENYSLKVNDTTYNLVKNGEDTDEYVTEENVEVKAGDILAFYGDETLQTIIPKAIGNNNCYSDAGVTTVLLDMNAKIYVDFKAGTVFCGGMTYGKFGMVVNNSYVEMAQNMNPVDPSFTEWTALGVSFAKDDVIKFVDNTSSTSGAVVFKVGTINSYSIADSFEVDADGAIKCIAEDGVDTDVYVKFKSGADEVYFGSVSEDDAAARAFAKAFNEAMENVCVADGSTEGSALQAAWGEMATAYGSLLQSAQEKVKGASISSLTTVMATFAAKYDYIYTKYGVSLSLTNFADRTISARSINIARNNSNVAILVIASISIVAFAGLGLFLAKRKKEAK